MLPATLNVNADFPHVDLQFGEPGNDNLISSVSCLVDSGAGVITANLTFIEGLIGMNSKVLVEIHTCKNGEWAPITMHGIVDPDAEGGNHIMELPVCFRLRTCHNLRDGNELHLLVASGTGVSVNFVLGNSWFEMIGAVIDYSSKCLRIAGYPDMQKFNLSFHRPREVKPEISGGDLASHEAAFKSLPLMCQVKKVIEVYDKRSQYLTYFTTLLHKLRVCTYVTVPAFIQSNAPSGNGDHNAQLSGTMGNAEGHPDLHVGRPTGYAE